MTLEEMTEYKKNYYENHKQHILNHMLTKIPCPDCGKVIARKSMFRHQHTVCGIVKEPKIKEPMGKCTCPVCNCEISKYNLARHMKTKQCQTVKLNLV